MGVLFVLGFVVAYLVSNYSEARFLVNRELYWIFFLALPISMLLQVDLVLETDLDEEEEDEEPGIQPNAPGAAFTVAKANQEQESAIRSLGTSQNKDDLDLLFEQDHTLEPEEDINRFDRFSVVNVIP